MASEERNGNCSEIICLRGNKEQTKYGDCFSDYRTYDLGVPQGSVLGPFLFILYINDIQTVLKYSSIYLFADDALLKITADSLEEAMTKINEDSDNLYKWLCYNKLKLNPDKTKWMQISLSTQHNQNGVLQIGGMIIEEVTKIKYLGIIIDNRLSFNDHFDYLFKKVAKSDLLPQYLSRKLVSINETTNVNLRNQNDFRILNLKKSACRNNVFVKGVTFYNQLPNEIKVSKHIYEFKRRIFNYLKENY